MDLTGKINCLDQLCYAKKLTFTEGREKGTNVILVSNGKMNFTVLCDKGMDIYNLSHKGVNISCLTKNGIINNSGEFNESFPAGMLYTCGLESIGGKTKDIHGKYHNIPADIESINADEKGITIKGTIRQCGLFKDNILVERTISIENNSDELNIITKVTNKGYKDAEYCLLFHMNVGYPMLDENVKIIAPVLSTTPRTEWAEKNIGKCFFMEQPIADTEEQVFFHKVEKGEVKVLNEKLKKIVTFEYDNAKLPEFIQWKSMIKGDYALGIEPATTTLDDGFKKKVLKSGESEIYKIKIRIEDLY